MPPFLKHLIFCYFAGYLIMSLSGDIEYTAFGVGKLCVYVILSVIFAKGVIGLYQDVKTWVKDFINGD